MIGFAFDDQAVLNIMWGMYQASIMENIQLKAQLQTAEETIKRLMPDSLDFDSPVDTSQVG